jgi:hypothetical protein
MKKKKIFLEKNFSSNSIYMELSKKFRKNTKNYFLL